MSKDAHRAPGADRPGATRPGPATRLTPERLDEIERRSDAGLADPADVAALIAEVREMHAIACTLAERARELTGRRDAVAAAAEAEYRRHGEEMDALTAERTERALDGPAGGEQP